MKSTFKHLAIVAAMFATTTAYADEAGRLFIIGEATPSGWDLDLAQALLSTAERPNVYTGTVYLKGGESNTFKFMSAHEWGSTEYGVPADAATVVNGEVRLSSGTLDSGYQKMSVAQDGNYLITINTESLQANITLSAYQDTEIRFCSLFLIGGATTGDWSVENGTPLYQEANSPYEYKTTANLKADGSFKIATALRGAGSFDAKYYYFKDAENAGKISTDSTDDRQWNVSKDGEYTVTVNTVSNVITIDEYNGSTTGIEDIAATSVNDNAAPAYYNLQGCKVDNPSNGVFIEVIGNNVKKVAL